MLVSIRYEMRKSVNKNGLRPLYMRISYRSERIEIATGLKIDPKNWNQKKQQIKKGSNCYDVYNLTIETLTNRVNRYAIQKQGVSSNEMFTGIRELLYQKKSNEVSFHDVYQMYFEQIQVSPATLQKYKATYSKYILGFEKDILKHKISFSKLTLEFFDKFKKYLLDSGLNDNSARKRFSNLYSFLEWATKREYNNNLKYRSVEKISKYQPDSFSLTQDELEKLISTRITSKPHLEKSKDLFLFQIFTGQRVSDIMKIRHSDILDGKWILRQKKEDSKPVIIPLTKICLDILDKYKNEEMPLPVKSTQKYNDDLKEMAKILGLDRLISKYWRSGSDSKTTIKPIYEIISSHTARRTNVTIGMELDIPKEIGMLVTNHAKSDMFDLYNKINVGSASSRYVSAWDARFK